MELVTVNQGEPRTTTLAIAEGTKNDHASVIKLARIYLSDLEQFGRVGFEIVPFGTAGGVQSREIAELNERQAMLLMSYMKNTTIIRQFKTRLVKTFYEMTESATNLPVVSDPHTRALIQLLADQDAIKSAQAVLTTQQHVISTGLAETRKEVIYLKENMRLENWQQISIQKAVNHKVELWKEMYPTLPFRKAYPAIYRHLKNKFSVPRYNEIPAVEYDRAMSIVKNLSMNQLAGL